MFDFLIDNALKNVWCPPNQDNQLIIEPKKITPIDGVYNTVSIINQSISLPIQSKRFHVYQIGQLDLELINLSDSTDIWTSFATVCATNNLIVDIYTNSGLQLPRVQSWYMVTPNKNLIIAVMDQPIVNVDLNTDPLFIRFYSNAYYQSNSLNPNLEFIEVNGGSMNTKLDILALQNKFNIANSRTNGATYAFVNGIKVSSIDLISTHIGDIAEYVYDSSIYQVIDLPISTLPIFHSRLDSKDKYLVHYPNTNDNSIDFQSEVDFFIIQQIDTNRHAGIYYHKNQADAVRSLTHKDYSISTAYAAGYKNSISGWTDVSLLTLRLHIHKSGYVRNLILENNRIEELYKLPDNKVIAAMVGTNATVPNWTADNLESSAYTEIMRSNKNNITRSLVQQAYGYNYISKIIGDTPSKVNPISKVIENIPYLLQFDSVAYEYDSNGVLIDWYQHLYGTTYFPRSNNTATVEFISGIANPKFFLDEVYGIKTGPLDPNLEYRFYTCPINGAQPSNNWTDVTNTSAVSIVNNTYTFNISSIDTYTLVRSNKNILAYDIFTMAESGVLEFILASSQDRGGNTALWPLQIPLGELDLMLNGYSLIEGIDYIVNFPNVVIINKKYLHNVLTDKQKITVRFTGHCKSDLTRTNINPNIGFIKYGLLSDNNKFDIRDDKVLRIIVGGKLYTRDQLEFAETSLGISIPNVLNGIPYSIKDVVIPLRGIGVIDTYTARDSSITIDTAVSNYMTAFYPEDNVTGLNVIDSLYPVYSPFISKIINDLNSGIINTELLEGNYSDQDINNILKNHLYYLDFDPINSKNQLDLNYVVIHPTNIDITIPLNIYQYNFINRVVNLYCNNLVSINHFVTVSS